MDLDLGGTWSVADGSVKGSSDDGNVVLLVGLNEALDGL
jgi:hypothetical protein